MAALLVDLWPVRISMPLCVAVTCKRSLQILQFSTPARDADFILIDYLITGSMNPFRPAIPLDRHQQLSRLSR
jgi:hypothetical protein